MNNLVRVDGLYLLVFNLLERVNSIFRQIKLGNINPIVYTKGKNDSFTNIDFLVQRIFENNFKNNYSSLHIVGEEDTSKECNIQGYDSYLSILEKHEIPVCLEKENLLENLGEVDLSKVKLFMDPIDSTKEFIKKNFNPVTTLVGFTLDNKPMFGFIHFPYLEDNNQCSETYFNIPKKGVFCLRNNSELLKLNPFTNSDNRTIYLSSSRLNPRLKELFKDYNIKHANGLGNKVIRTIEDDSVYISSQEGLGYWDICSGHCILNELGGGACYINGEEIVYDAVENTQFVKNLVTMSPNNEKLKNCLKILENI